MSDGKVRRVDYSPDEYISGVAGLLSAEEQGVYWMICTLIMSEGGPIQNNELRVAGLCQLRRAGARKIIDHLIDIGKLSLTPDGKLAQKRAITEVEVSKKRIKSAQENGAKGGRPAQKDKEINGGDKAIGSSPAKLSLTTNYQLPEEEDSSFASAQPAPELPLAPPTTAEPVTKKKKGGEPGSAEDRYWALAPQAAARGVAKSLLGQLSNALNGDFERGIGILADALAAKSPRPYLAKIIRNVAAERAPPAVGGVPAWITEARAGGYPVTKEGRFWRMSGALYDDEGEQIGN